MSGLVGMRYSMMDRDAAKPLGDDEGGNSRAIPILNFGAAVGLFLPPKSETTILEPF